MPASHAFVRSSSLPGGSEPPASPTTMASTLCNHCTHSNHSTPAPSLPYLTIRTDNHFPTDVPLVNNSYPLYEQHPKPSLDPHHDNAAFAGHQHAPVPAPAAAPSTISPPWSSDYCSPYWLNEAEPQQHQHQQDYHHAMPTFNDYSSYGAPCSSPLPSVSDVYMPATPAHSPGYFRVPSPVYRENSGCGDVQQPPSPLSSSSAIHSGLGLSGTVRDAAQGMLYIYPALDPVMALNAPPTLSEELSNPGIAPGIAPSRPDHPADMLQQGQNQHETACSHPASDSFGVAAYNLVPSRRRSEADHDAKTMQKAEYDQPKSIVPKDGYNEYHEPDGPGTGEAIRGCLFSNGDAYSQHGRSDIGTSESNDCFSFVDFYNDHDSDHDSNVGHGPSNYDGMTTSRRHSGVVIGDGAGDSAPPRNGARLTFSDSNQHHQLAGEASSSGQAGGVSSDETNDHHHPQPLQGPEHTNANDDEYSCTVLGCTRRFSTASNMAKHRREAHRPGNPRMLPGPSRCTRINPDTGSPCNTDFSRPYDLTRHEESVHNSQKVHCDICTTKAFNRQDALTRHKKNKHGVVKSRKKRKVEKDN